MLSKFCSNRATVSRIPKLWHVRTLRSTPTPIIPKECRGSGLSEPKRRFACQLLELLRSTILSKETKGVTEDSWMEDFTEVMRGIVDSAEEETEELRV